MKMKIKNMIGQKRISIVKSYPSILLNYIEDMVSYYRHSTVFFEDTTNKLECQIILDYHSVEKGLLFENTKPRFAKDRIINLHKRLALDEIISLVNKSQIRVAYNIMCKYYELHFDKSEDISDYFTEEQYENYKSILSNKYDFNFQGAVDLD
ncbi:nitroreductase, partial [Vibrio cyclitrophicus]